mmetsp:Transcript_42574/g.101310  ORF Transcript_42574/g.101310 Transcript_42574/m.101310 type:complete len:201 (-) Transcript_42574:4995-5597(-)
MRNETEAVLLSIAWILIVSSTSACVAIRSMSKVQRPPVALVARSCTRVRISFNGSNTIRTTQVSGDAADGGSRTSTRRDEASMSRCSGSGIISTNTSLETAPTPETDPARSRCRSCMMRSRARHWNFPRNCVPGASAVPTTGYTHVQGSKPSVGPEPTETPSVMHVTTTAQRCSCIRIGSNTNPMSMSCPGPSVISWAGV